MLDSQNEKEGRASSLKGKIPDCKSWLLSIAGALLASYSLSIWGEPCSAGASRKSALAVPHWTQCIAVSIATKSNLDETSSGTNRKVLA